MPKVRFVSLVMKHIRGGESASSGPQRSMCVLHVCDAN